MKQLIIFLAICLGGINSCFAQTTDPVKTVKDSTVHRYFIISAGTIINAFFNDKPLSIESIEDFNQYIAANIKKLKDSWVVVSGKPNEGTFNEVLKTLGHFRFKHVTKNILKD